MAGTREREEKPELNWVHIGAGTPEGNMGRIFNEMNRRFGNEIRLNLTSMVGGRIQRFRPLAQEKGAGKAVKEGVEDAPLSVDVVTVHADDYIQAAMALARLDLIGGSMAQAPIIVHLKNDAGARVLLNHLRVRKITHGDDVEQKLVTQVHRQVLSSRWPRLFPSPPKA